MPALVDVPEAQQGRHAEPQEQHEQQEHDQAFCGAGCGEIPFEDSMLRIVSVLYHPNDEMHTVEIRISYGSACLLGNALLTLNTSDANDDTLVQLLRASYLQCDGVSLNCLLRSTFILDVMQTTATACPFQPRPT